MDQGIRKTVLQHLGPMSVAQFLADYWQQKPVLIRNALTDIPVLDPDELAGFSLEEGVESRLIRERPKKGQPLQSGWRVEQGPFGESTFSKLPSKHWTLLVQAANLLSPPLHELLHRFRFIPNWRVDDLMVSYAVDGGGVGPHFDYYDVFLLQASGTRRWRIGQKCSSASPLRSDTDCKILAEFDTVEEWSVHPGDLLYIPPQIAHWGTAEGECMTYSIGFRAPAFGDMLLDYSQEIASMLTADQRFGDARRNPAANPGLISDLDLTKVTHQLRELLADESRIADWFGRFMTQPQREVLHFNEVNPVPQLAPHIRAAYRPYSGGRAHLYLDGEQFTASLVLAQRVCAYEPIDALGYAAEDRALINHLISESYLQ